MVTRFTQKIKKKSSATRSDRNRTPFRALDAEFTTTDIDRMRSQWTNNSLFKKELTENVSDKTAKKIGSPGDLRDMLYKARLDGAEILATHP